jgi:hypothetical protein
LKYFTPATSGKVWVRVKNKYNCANADTVSLIVNKSPVVNIGNDTSICENAVLILKAGIQPSGTTLLWSDGSSEPALAVKREGLYWLKATNEQNCSTTDEMYVSLKPAPDVNLGPDTTITGFDYLYLNAGYYGYPTSYWWNNYPGYQTRFYFGGDYPVGTDTVFVQVTDPNNCSATDSIRITMVQDFRYAHACEGMDVYFAIGITLSVDSVAWDFGDSDQDSGFITSHKYEAAGEYDVKSVIYSRNQPDTLEKKIQIVPVPHVNLGDDITIEPNSILTLDAGTYETPVDYLWDNYANTQYRYIEGNKLDTGTHRYFVTVVTRVNQCTASDTIRVTLRDIAQSDPGDIQPMINVYPNPVRDIFYIDNPGNAPLKATLSDASGRIAGKWDLVPGKNEQNIPECKAGMYTLRLTDGKGFVYEIKIIKL